MFKCQPQNNYDDTDDISFLFSCRSDRREKIRKIVSLFFPTKIKKKLFGVNQKMFRRDR